jgi:diamine N-acetyltransferase
MTLTLEPLGPHNISAAVRIEPHRGQKRFVASVAESVAEAYVHPAAWPRVVCDDGEVLAFIMASFDPTNEIDAFRCGVWRLVVGADAQGRGAGRFAVEQVAAEARRRGQDRMTVLWIPGKDGPERFYERVGFVPTGEILFDQVVGERLL